MVKIISILEWSFIRNSLIIMNCLFSSSLDTFISSHLWKRVVQPREYIQVYDKGNTLAKSKIIAVMITRTISKDSNFVTFCYTISANKNNSL